MWINHKDYVSRKEYSKAQFTWVCHYQAKLDKDSSSWSSLHVREVKIGDFYREGRMYGALNLMDYKQFKLRLTKNRYNFYYTRHYDKDRLRNHYKYNRNGKKHPRDYSEKKVLSEKEQAKREWREFKNDPRDQKRYRSRTTAFKAANKRTHRAYENYCINSDQYDKLHDRTWKQMEDWWSYD
jgi:hypothetical protein